VRFARLPSASAKPGRNGQNPLQAAETAALQQALNDHGGNRRELAATLGISERTLYRKLRALEA
jgi:DNA-binding NtrC family response regulator